VKPFLDQTLLQRNIQHFSQASKTPFVMQPLLAELGENDCTDTTFNILDSTRTLPEKIPKYPKLLLSSLATIRPTLPLDMTFDDMCTWLSKWRENTTTSPTGKPLGIYKALVKTMRYILLTCLETKYNYDYNNTTSEAPLDEQCLQIQFALITMAVQHCHTFNRWKTVHNYLLEKIPGLPLINKRRVIHIYKAGVEYYSKVLHITQIC
jgi:hypothetical protein